MSSSRSTFCGSFPRSIAIPFASADEFNKVGKLTIQFRKHDLGCKIERDPFTPPTIPHKRWIESLRGDNATPLSVKLKTPYPAMHEIIPCQNHAHGYVSMDKYREKEDEEEEAGVQKLKCSNNTNYDARTWDLANLHSKHFSQPCSLRWALYQLHRPPRCCKISPSAR